MALYAILAPEQAVHGAVELVLPGVLDAEFLAERVGERLGSQAMGGGQLGAGIQDPGEDHGGGQRPLAGASPVEELLEAQAASDAEYGGNVAVGSEAEDGEGLEREGSATPPLRRIRRPSTSSSGHLARVRFLTSPWTSPSKQSCLVWV